MRESKMDILRNRNKKRINMYHCTFHTGTHTHTGIILGIQNQILLDKYTHPKLSCVALHPGHFNHFQKVTNRQQVTRSSKAKQDICLAQHRYSPVSLVSIGVNQLGCICCAGWQL